MERTIPDLLAGAVAGAAFADLGFPPSIVRGFALLARTAGLVSPLAEEMAEPIGAAALARGAIRGRRRPPDRRR